MPEAGEPKRTTSALNLADRWDHVLARWGVNRTGHRVEPGLYALGEPTEDAPVFVTANYTLSFDALRVALAGTDSYVLVLDTKGINVWCAAGKGTFGTDELVRRIESTGLRLVVRHRVLILPQLGAPGVAAHEVKARSGFLVKYGPVRAADLPEFLRTRQATPAMRRVQFGLADRIVLIPVELVHVLIPMAIAAAVLYFVAGPLAAAAAITAILAGVILFPILLPWIPTHDLTTKGLILGGVAALPFSLAALLGSVGMAWWMRAGMTLGYLLAMPPVTAFLALNFTGSTTYTSRSGVRHEIFAYIPVMAWTFGIGLVLTIVLVLI
jgi:hypothetical protein